MIENINPSLRGMIIPTINVCGLAFPFILAHFVAACKVVQLFSHADLVDKSIFVGYAFSIVCLSIMAFPFYYGVAWIVIVYMTPGIAAKLFHVKVISENCVRVVNDSNYKYVVEDTISKYALLRGFIGHVRRIFFDEKMFYLIKAYGSNGEALFCFPLLRFDDSIDFLITIYKARNEKT